MDINARAVGFHASMFLWNYKATKVHPVMKPMLIMLAHSKIHSLRVGRVGRRKKGCGTWHFHECHSSEVLIIGSELLLMSEGLNWVCKLSSICCGCSFSCPPEFFTLIIQTHEVVRNLRNLKEREAWHHAHTLENASFVHDLHYFYIFIIIIIRKMH